MKHHLHSEQFDGALHASCGRFPHDPFPGEKYSDFILTSETAFANLDKIDRCQYCEADQFPHGMPDGYGKDI